MALSIPVGSGIVYAVRSSCFFEGTRLNERSDLLADSERRRAERFQNTSDRDAYVAAHALIRLVLSRTFGVEPQDWYFSANALGKPYVTRPLCATGVQISISHTRGGVACGIGIGSAIGVDIEAFNVRSRRGDPLALARNLFSVREVGSLTRMHEVDRPLQFVKLWTLKESYSKALGLGLAFPLSATTFDVLGEEITVHALAETAIETEKWQFGLRVFDHEFVVAFALKRMADGLAGLVGNVESTAPTGVRFPAKV